MKTYPKKVQRILNQFSRLENTYENCENLNNTLKAVNWEIQYNLEAEIIKIQRLKRNNMETLDKKIKELHKRWVDLKSKEYIYNTHTYWETREKLSKDFTILYQEIKDITALNKKSILIMLRLNLIFRTIPFHQFGLCIDLGKI